MGTTALLIAAFVLGILMGVMLTRWAIQDRAYEQYLNGWHRGFDRGYRAKERGEAVVLAPTRIDYNKER